MDQIDSFLSQANDDEYLMIKIALIFGISGACRGDELTNLRDDDIEDVVLSLIITIPNTKTKISRTFVVTRTEGNTNILDLHRKYAALRPPHTSHGLSDPTLYTGHCLCRSSATLLADAGADDYKTSRRLLRTQTDQFYTVQTAGLVSSRFLSASASPLLDRLLVFPVIVNVAG
ncbi:hypothetical protein NQ317_003293 [Molorchus minor]|uniref:Tyr recombinase domain-containing protein n=1 Tax=Molorchus minor TaxID=1323400 RepID=A0ABQ9J6F6_9CUCU|nr:hypothetical protein NQ317_003293 [Molorchus minor]